MEKNSISKKRNKTINSKLLISSRNNQNSLCYDYYINIILVCFKLCGWNIATEDIESKVEWPITFKIIFTIHTLSVVMPLLFFPYFCYANWGNFAEILLEVIVVIVNNLGLSKIYTIYEHGGLIQSVLHDIRMKIWNFGKDSQRQEIVLKGARWQKIIIQFYLWFFTSMIVLMLMRPIFTITSEGLPFPNSISFLSMDNLWNFAFLYLAQVVDCFFVITTVIAFDGMLLSFAMQISVEIKYMILKIRTLGSPNTKNPGNNSTRDLEILINICDDYNYLKSLVKRIEIIYATIITVNLVHFSAYFCSALFLINTNIEINYTYYVALIAGLIELLFNFASGQFISNKFDELYSEVIHCNWTNLNRIQQKNYMLILMMLQPKVYLKTPFCQLLITTFGSILQSGYSYYTIMRRITNK